MYTSRHGFGHAVRTATTLERLVERMPVDLHLRGPSPPPAWPEGLEPYTLSSSEEASDVGVVQSHALEIDLEATRRELEAWQTGAEEATEREAVWLAGNADAVLADMPPMPFEAARRAGIPAVAHGNFSWDWIYREMGLDDDAGPARRAYAYAEFLIELEPACPMPAFKRRHRVGELGRLSQVEPAKTRSALGLADHTRLVLLAVRGTDTQACRLPAKEQAVVYIAPDIPLERDDVISDRGLPFIDILDAADAVVAKPGYGIYGDTWTAGSRVLLAPRRGFPEDRILEAAFRRRPGTFVLDPGCLERGGWSDQLRSILEVNRPPRREASADRRAARYIRSWFTV